jgi:molybdopterin-containing oxidoreductase family iron-sulfur binding subunit
MKRRTLTVRECEPGRFAGSCSEKCTFCLQRIRRAEDTAKSEGRPVRDGEVVPACAQACPTNAIVFGHIDEPDTEVNRLAEAARNRNYQMLEELGTHPRITYLKGGSSNG